MNSRNYIVFHSYNTKGRLVSTEGALLEDTNKSNPLVPAVPLSPVGILAMQWKNGKIKSKPCNGKIKIESNTLRVGAWVFLRTGARSSNTKCILLLERQLDLIHLFIVGLVMFMILGIGKDNQRAANREQHG